MGALFSNVIPLGVVLLGLQTLRPFEALGLSPFMGLIGHQLKFL